MIRNSARRLLGSLGIASVALLPAPSMAQLGPVSGLPVAVKSFAELKELSKFTDPAALAYLDQAYRIAGEQWPTTLAFRCTAQMSHVESGLPDPAPTKVFDNLFYIGHADVGAWALRTSDGIVLFDALLNEADGRKLATGLEKLGLDPHQVKMILLTHEHFDHYGGANFFKTTYGTRIGASQVAWDAMAHMPADRGPAPVRGPNDLVLTDGGMVTLGDTTITSVLTPGHTAGTTSFIFPARDRGQKVMVAEWGGNGVPKTLEGRLTFRRSLQHFTEFTEQAGVTAEIGAHGDTDNLLPRLDQVRQLKANDANPFNLGRPGYLRYEAAFTLCTAADVAQSLADASTPKPR